MLERRTDLFIRRGVPEYLRSDNGSEFTARVVRQWLARVGVRTLYIEPGAVFANDRQAVARRVYPSRADSVGVALFSIGGPTRVPTVQAWDMMPSTPF